MCGRIHISSGSGRTPAGTSERKRTGADRGSLVIPARLACRGPLLLLIAVLVVRHGCACLRSSKILEIPNCIVVNAARDFQESRPGEVAEGREGRKCGALDSVARASCYVQSNVSICDPKDKSRRVQSSSPLGTGKKRQLADWIANQTAATAVMAHVPKKKVQCRYGACLSALTFFYNVPARDTFPNHF